MDIWEANKIVIDRVRALDPENAKKIAGMLLLQDNNEKDLIRLAFGPDHLIQSFVTRAHAKLAAKPSSLLPTGRPWGVPSLGGEQLRVDGGEALYPVEYDCWSPAASEHRRSFSLSNAKVNAAGAWRPCRYYARGFCKNGSSCRFLHVLPEDYATAAEREVAVMQRPKVFAARPPPLLKSAFPFSPSPKGLNFLFQQQQPQSELQRSAAVLLGGGEDMVRFAMRTPRMDCGDLMNSHTARQIYLTFLPDSTFSTEDVSSYFSAFGPVQDVRIPYQPKRMFGFVSFFYPETVKIILSKGNPHFVGDARVLVKPYKEKGKVPERLRKLQQQHPHQGEFRGGMPPTGLLNPGDHYDLQHAPIGTRMMLGEIANQNPFLRMKLEEQRQAAELQRAIELQGRRFMGLQLLDLNGKAHHLSSPVGSPMSLGQTDGKVIVNGSNNVVQDNKPNSDSSIAMSAPASSAISAIVEEGKHEEQQSEEDGDGTPKKAVNPGEEKGESGPVAPGLNVACGFQESGVDHNLPESLFASPTKPKVSTDNIGAMAAQNGDISPHYMASSLFPPASSLEHPPFNSCFFQVPRFTSGHEAIGL